MKKISKFMVLAFAVLAFAACSDDKNDDNTNSNGNTVATVNVSFFRGQIKVGNFTMDSVIVKTTCNGSKRIAQVMLYQVSFSSYMPTKIDMNISGLNLAVNNKDTILNGEDINPTVAGQEYPNYVVTNFNGDITKDSLNISTKFGSYSMTFAGKRK